VREKAVKFSRRLFRFSRKHSKDWANRAEGLKARLAQLKGSEPVDDQTLVSRIRTELGRLVEHPRRMLVESDHGNIHLSGDCLSGEVEAVADKISEIHGVKHLKSDLHPSSSFRPGETQYLH
jgi:hypothetical protein